MFLDGMLVYEDFSAGASIANNPAAAYPTAIGASYFDVSNGFAPSFIGSIDSIRISDTARYTANFTAPTGDMTSDGFTQLLYNFASAEVVGGVVQDMSGSGRTGTFGTGFAGATSPTIVTAIPEPGTYAALAALAALGLVVRRRAGKPRVGASPMGSVVLLLVGVLIAAGAHGQTVVQTVGDIDGFGYGAGTVSPGSNVLANVYDNRSSDPSFTDHTIPDTGGTTTFSFTISFGQSFASIQSATLTIALQEVEQLGNVITLDGVAIMASRDAYLINGSALTGTSQIGFFDTVVSQGDFHTDRVLLQLPASFFPALTDGEAILAITGTGESYAIDYVQLEIVAVPEPSTVALWGGLGVLGFALRRCRRSCPGHLMPPRA